MKNSPYLNKPTRSEAEVYGPTPGPWIVTSCADVWVEHRQPRTKTDNGFNGVAHCGDISWPNSQLRQAEWKANARLIAAAPELLAALKEALPSLERLATEEARANRAPTGQRPRLSAKRRFESARAAIAKATK